MDNTVEDDIRKTAEKIIEFFKLGYELKNDYPTILNKILDLEKAKDYFLLYYTNQFNLDFFDDL